MFVSRHCFGVQRNIGVAGRDVDGADEAGQPFVLVCAADDDVLVYQEVLLEADVEVGGGVEGRDFLGQDLDGFNVSFWEPGGSRDPLLQESAVDPPNAVVVEPVPNETGLEHMTR